MRLVFLCVCLCLSLTLGSCAPVGGVQAVPPLPVRDLPAEDDRRAAVWSSPNFTLHGKASDPLVRSMLTDLEGLRQSLHDIHGITPDPEARPLDILFVDDPNTYAQFQIGQSSTAFYIQSMLGRTVIINAALLEDDPQDGWRVLMHEYAHHFTSLQLSHAVPIWMNEGLSEFYATWHADADGTATYGHVYPELRDWLVANPVPQSVLDQTLAELSDYPNLPGYYSEAAQARQFRFYSLSWALTHWAHHTQAGRQSWADAIDALQAGQPPAAAFPPDLAEQLDAYLRAPVTTPLRAQAGPRDIPITRTELDTEDYTARLGLMLAIDGVPTRDFFLSDGPWSESYAALEMAGFGAYVPARKRMAKAVAEYPDNADLQRFSAWLDLRISQIIGGGQFIHRHWDRKSLEQVAVDKANAYIREFGPDSDLDMMVLTAKGRPLYGLGDGRTAIYERVLESGHLDRYPLDALNLLEVMISRREFDRAETALDRIALWADLTPLNAAYLEDTRADIAVNRRIAAESPAP